MTRKVLVLNGPNLNRLGQRRPERYGTATLVDVINGMKSLAVKLDMEIHDFQSNHEGDLIDFVHANTDADGIIVNPAGLTLYGRSLLDAVGDIRKPFAVVHIAQLYKIGDIYGPETRDHWKAFGDVYVCGLGIHGYNASLLRLHELMSGKQQEHLLGIA